MTIKVLHLSGERSWRGGEQQIAYLIDELARLGVVNYVAAKEHSAFETHCKKNNIPVFGLPFKNSIDLKTALAIKSICREQQIDIVHMHSAKSHGIGVLSAVTGNSVPLILSRRVDFVPKKSWFTKWKYNHAAIKRILCISETIHSIIKVYIKRPDKSITVHSGVDLSKFLQWNPTLHKLRKEYSLEPEVVLIGNTSALEEHKDYTTFIDTIAILSKKDLPVKAFIIGKGSLESKLKDYVLQKGLEHIILFTGFRNDIIDILPELTIFLMTSNEEGLGTSVLDAFAAGVPVVATNAGGIPEMVIPEETGLLAPVGHAQLLAEHLERLIKDDHLRNKLIRGAKEKVKEFSKEATAVKTLAVYKEVLSEERHNEV